KALNKSYVSPLLFYDVKPGDIHGPLSQFQFTLCEKTSILNLMRSLNGRLPADHQLSDQLLRKEFDVWWPDLEKRLKDTQQKQPFSTHTGYAWLYTADDVALALSEVTCGDVWVITPDFAGNMWIPPFREVIQETHERGVAYTVIVPSSGETEGV